jgi:hypothetical protein
LAAQQDVKKIIKTIKQDETQPVAKKKQRV